MQSAWLEEHRPSGIGYFWGLIVKIDALARTYVVGEQRGK